MQIVLPGALPDVSAASALASHVEKASPHLAGWLARAHANVIPADPTDTFCTAYEYWLLRRHGFSPIDGERPSAGLAAVLACESGTPTGSAEPLWLGQLVHVAPARDGAALIPATELEIAPEENAALLEAAAPYFPDSGFAVAPFDALHWCVTPPPGYTPACASPALVSITSVNDWWTQDVAGRSWRRLVNELQMLWFDHPVNREREARGLRPVNSLWLYGGAAPDRLSFKSDAGSDRPRILRSLQGPALVQDWGSWLQELEQLDRDEFAGMPDMPQLILTGNDRIIELTTARQGFMAKLMGRRQDWRRWWSARN